MAHRSGGAGGLDRGAENRHHRLRLIDRLAVVASWCCPMQVLPFPFTVLREPAPDATCTCEHWIHCACICHGVHCDPGEATCDMAFLPDDGGLTPIGCPDCTPGRGAPHYLGCQLIGWHVVVPPVHGLS